MGVPDGSVIQYKLRIARCGREMIEDNNKDKRQLLAELSALRQENAQLRKSVTEPKRRERVSQESEQEYKDFADQLPETVVEFDVNGNLTFMNMDGLKTFGYTKQDLEQGLDVPQAMAPEDRDRAKENIARVVRGEESNGNEYTMIKKDGSRFPSFIHGNAVVRDNKIVGVRAIVVDTSERKRTEEALRRAEEECRKERDRATEYLNIAGVMLLGLDREGRVTLLNRKGHELLGYEEGELMGKDWVSTCLPMRVREQVTPVIRNLIGGDLESVEYYENPVVTKQGEERIIAWHNTLLRDESGNIIGSLSSGEDITERKAAEEALLKSKHRYDALAANIPVGVYLLRTTPVYKFVFDYVSPRMAEILGLSAESILTDSQIVFRTIHPEELENFVSLNRVRIETRQPFLWEGRVIVKETIKWLRIESRPEPLDNGDTLWHGIIADITEEKQIEGALRESEQRLQALMNAAPIAITWADLEGNQKYINHKHYELFGYTLGEVPTVAEWRRQAYPDPTYRETVPSLLAEYKKGKALPPYEATVTCKDGSQRHVIGLAAAVSNMILLMLNDVTELKHVEFQLQQAQKMEAVGHLAGGIAHDFNNLLSVIIGFGTLIEMDLEPDSPHRPYIGEILRAAERAARLTESLLAYSRKQIIQPVPLNLNDSIKHQKNLLKRLIGEDIRILPKLSKEPLVIMADPGQMDQVVMNIVTNARDAMPQGGTIIIGTMRTEIDDAFIASHGFGTPGAYALITISDTGTGMDEDTMRRIFNPFFTTKEVGKGTGLGLSVVYGIVKQNNGYIDVESEPGKGTTFLIYLPVAVALAIPSEREDTSQFTGGHETILVAEDEDAVRSLTRTVLEKAGYTVIEARDGADALRVFQETPQVIDVALLDVVMPGMNGKQVYERIKEIKPEQKVLFTSGYTDDIIAKKGILEYGLV